jgi:hypothetical protein
VNGIPENENVNSVREDPKRKGLLFAGTERAVYVSFDDGDHWQSLRLNMPATSIRDLLIKDDDLAVGTHGRGFWVLDDITPLRQLSDKIIAGKAYLFTPELTYRVRWNTNSDTPLPPDVPAGQNPPDGAIFNYYLKSSTSAPVTLEILDASGKTVRRFSSADPIPQVSPELNIPAYWVRPPEVLSGAAGFHRFVWDMHYAPVPGIRVEYPIAAVYKNTAPAPTSPWIMPGKYTVVLTVDGQKFTQPLTVQMDPRVKTPTEGLQQQFDLSQQLYQDLLTLQSVASRVQGIRSQIKSQRDKASGADAAKLDEVSKQLDALVGTEEEDEEGAPRRGPHHGTLAAQRASLLQVLSMLQEVDVAPTTQVAQTVPKLNQSTEALMQEWQKFVTDQLTPLRIQP